MAAKGMQFPWRWQGGTISTNLDITWEMSIVMDVEKYRREFVNRVVQARGAMKQSEVAEILSIPLSTYKSYERRSLIPHERLLPFCDATGVDLHWLLGNATQSSSQTLIEFLWETDVEHRLSSQHCPNLNDVGIDYEHDKVMGLRRWEIDGVDAKAKKMKPIMDRHKPLRNFTFRHTDNLGQCHEFQISGFPLFDQTGKFTGYRGTARVTRIATKISMARHGRQKAGGGRSGLG